MWQLTTYFIQPISTDLRLRLVAHTFSFSINTYTIYWSLASPPFIAASASLLLLLIPLMIVPSRLLLLPLLLYLVRVIKLNHQTAHWILVAVRAGILNYCKIRQFRCKVCTRLHHSIIDFAKTNSGEGLAGPLPNFLPRSCLGFRPRFGLRAPQFSCVLRPRFRHGHDAIHS